MADTTITSANSIFTLVVSGLFLAPYQLKGYSADAAFATEAIDFAETQMGVDGRMTAGFIYAPTPMTITLQADSPSRGEFFLPLIAASRTLQDIYYMSGTITLPSTGESFTLTRGVLKNGHQIPTAAKVLQPVQFHIDWESVNQAVL